MTPPAGIGNTPEQRIIKVEFRSVVEGDNRKFVGRPVVYNRQSEDLGFFETIHPGASTNALRTSDARALYGHNSESLLPLGRMSAGTLRAVETDSGVDIEIDPPDTAFARDLTVSIDRRDVQDMSFAFYVERDEWKEKDGIWYRDIFEIKEFLDFSFVAYPAYVDTTAAMRSLGLAKQARNSAVDEKRIRALKADSLKTESRGKRP